MTSPEQIADRILDAHPELIERWAKGLINPSGTVRK